MSAQNKPTAQIRLLAAVNVLWVIAAWTPFALCQSKSGPKGNGIQEITALELRRAEAVVHRDTGLLDQITSDNSVRILPTGLLETKQDLLMQLKSGSVTYSSIDVDQLDVKIYGDTAVVTGRSVFQGQRAGKPFTGKCRFSRVWIKRTGRWQEIMFQLTAITQP
jgi:hypothetical protein